MDDYEKFMMELHEICTHCGVEFWADRCNDKESGWVCDECLIIEKLEEDNG